MANSQDNTVEIQQLAFYEVRPEALERVDAAIHEFVGYIRSNEPGTLRYDVLQEKEHSTRFVHIFIFKDQQAHTRQVSSVEVKKFSDILYPECLAPVEFIDYALIDSKNTM
jgi:quinol monooxygenase YgiN